MSKKVVLAYSGGLDTSCAITWLKEKGYTVIAFIADVGQRENYSAIKKRALKTGAAKVYVKNLQKEFINDYIVPTLKADAMYEGKYLLATALSRPIIAKHLVAIAKKENAKYIAHGCTGKGNDQVRFEVSAAILAPSLKIIAPVRIWEFKSREQEIDYAKRKKIPIDVTKKKVYSIDKNLWGISIECGILEDPWKEPPSDAYQWTVDPKHAPNKPQYVDIEFQKGVPVAVNKKRYPLDKLIEKVCGMACNHGVGRIDMVENRLVGIKSREIYEAPGATVLYVAHKGLEALVLDRETLHFKELVSQKYSQLVYYGLWFCDLKKSLDAFVDQTQKRISGTIRIKLHKGSAVVVGRKSPHSRYKETLATYTEKDTFDQRLAEGFVKLWGLPHMK